MNQASESASELVPSSAWAGYKGHLLVLLAAVLWSTSGFFAKAPWFDGWPSESRGLMLAFWRSAFAALVLVPMIRRPCWRFAMLPMVVCFAVMVGSFMSAMVYGPAANAIWLQYLAPAWVVLIGFMLGKESVSRADLQMIACCLGAVALILLNEFREGGSAFATAMGILSGISFAGVVLSMRSLRGVDPAWLITLNHSCTALLLLPWFIQVEGTVPPASYLALALFGIFQMSLPYVLFARGLRTVTGPEASVLSLVEPILVPIWVFIAWSSHPSYQAPKVWTIAGGIIICAALLLRYLPAIYSASKSARRRKTLSQSDRRIDIQ